MTFNEQQNMYYNDIPRFAYCYNDYQKYIANCCFLEMMYPCYRNLHTEINFGNPDLVYDCINFCWNQSNPENLSDSSYLLKRLSSAMPNMDKHYGSGRYCSGAIYLVRNLRLVLKNRESNIQEVSRNYLDEVDREIMYDCFSDEEIKTAWESDLYVKERDFLMNLLKEIKEIKQYDGIYIRNTAKEKSPFVIWSNKLGNNIKFAT
jgi:uncharacterized protein YjaG (DUF416 family)